MADSTEGDTGVLYLGLLTLILIGLIAGLVIHSFIIGVNVTDWWKGRSVTPVDHIVTSLGISRMGAQCVNILVMIVNSTITQVFLGMIYVFLSYANFWLTSLLSIIYCLKISNFHSRLFLYLRGIIVHRAVYLIGASVLLSVFNCLVAYLIFITELTKGTIYNATMLNMSMDCIFSNYTYNFIIGPFFPFLFYCISSILLFTSLYQHMMKMKMSSNLSISLESYYSVMKLVSVTFIYNTLYFIGHLTFQFYYYSHCVGLDWLFIVLGFLPVLHSSYLIYRTAKLRSQMSKVLQDVTDFLFQRKDTETRENIEVVAL